MNLKFAQIRNQIIEERKKSEDDNVTFVNKKEAEPTNFQKDKPIEE